MRYLAGMFAHRRAETAKAPEPPPEAVRWREAQQERERQAEREEIERLRASDEAFAEYIKRVGFHFPGDAISESSRLSAGPRTWRGRLGGVIDALRGRDHS